MTPKPFQNLKLIYGIIYALYGYIIGFFMANLFFFVAASLISLVVDVELPPPEWAILFSEAMYYGAYGLTILAAIKKGVNKGNRLMSEGDLKENLASAVRSLIISLFALVIFSFLLMYVSTTMY